MKYLTLKSSVFVFLKKENVMFYNSETGAKFIFQCTEELKNIVLQFLDISNMYSIPLKETYSFDTNCWIHGILENGYAFISQDNNVHSIPPYLTLSSQCERNISRYLHSVVINCGCYVENDYYKQFLYPIYCDVDIEENFLQDVDENTLGNFYSKLMGSEDLTEYYRKKPSSKFSSGYDIGQVKIGVAPQNIESAVDQLMRYIKYDEKQSLIVKAIAIFYYLYFIKPFENYSEEVAILTMKKFLASNDVNAVAPYIAFEVLLVDKAALESKINDCQKSGDLTYLVNYILNLLDPIIDQMEDDIAKSQAQTLKVDTFQADPLPPRPENKEPIFKEGRETVSIPIVEKVPLTEKELHETGFNEEENAENEPLDEEIKEEAPVLNEQEVTTEETVQKEEVSNLDVNETPKAEEKVEEVKTIDSPSEEEKRAREELARPMQPTIEGAEKLHFSQNLAISNVPTGLSEEDAQKLETHLMELNPSLSRGQAYFYARHCTIGMYYTVDQYKKEVGCAYETARCNMNNLVLLGYYKKATLKKKYVYIPVKRN